MNKYLHNFKNLSKWDSNKLDVFLKDTILLLKAYFGSRNAIKILMQKNTTLGRVCCYSPFQQNSYCHVMNKYLSKDFRKVENFLLFNSKSNLRLSFLLYNFFKKNRQIDQVELLDDYFHDKHLSHIRKINLKQPLYIHNITAPKIQICDNYEIKVSVIITVYNCEELIYHAVTSIVNQTYKNIEIIIVNDGSTDNTLSILQSLKNKFSNIKMLSIENSGTYIARNVGLTYAIGDYITFHDADDWAHPQRIEEHVKIHEENDDCSGTLSLLTRVTPEGYFYAKQIYPIDRNCMLSLMFSRDIFQKIGYFRVGRFGNDSEYYERIQKFIDGKVYKIDKVLTICAQRANSLTTTPITSNEIGKNGRRMHQMKRWRQWHNLHLRKNNIPFVEFDIDNFFVKEFL